MIRKLILGAAPALILMSSSAIAAVPEWKVSEVSGNVQLSEGGRSRAATKGALLASGAMITTARGGRAVIVRGQEFVVISPGTRIRVPAADSPNKIMQLIEDWGSALFKIEKKSTPHFGVQTPYLAAVVKGTTFTVTVGEEGADVKVTEGAVEVSTLDGGASDLVRPGVVATVGKSDVYKLTVQGDETKVLRSSQGPAAGLVSTPAVPEPVRIASVITEEPFSLEDATGGVLEGGSAAEMVQADFIAQSRAAEADDLPATGGGGRPEDPGKPDEVGKPDDAGKPADPGKSDPGKPDDAGKPGGGKPEDPGKPGDPGKPEDPGKPGGGKPEDPGKPADPGKPGDPGKPDDSDKPGNPDKPDDVGKPDKDKPGKDDDKENPGKGDDADKPGKGDDADKPGKGNDDDDDNSGPGKGGDDDDDDNSGPGKGGDDDDDDDDDD